MHVQHWNHHELKATANDRVATQAYNFFSSTHQRRDIFLLRYILRDWANEKAVGGCGCLWEDEGWYGLRQPIFLHIRPKDDQGAEGIVFEGQATRIGACGDAVKP